MRQPIPEKKKSTTDSYYRRIFETARDGILILDADAGRIDDVNPRLLDLLGYAREELLNKKFREIGLFKNRKIAEDLFHKLHKEGHVRDETLWLKAKDGRLVKAEFEGRAYQAGGKNVFQVNIRDTTELNREEELILAQRDLALAIGKAESYEEGMRSCLETAIRISEMDCGGVYLVDENSGAIDLILHQGLSAEFVAKVSHYEKNSPHAQLILAGKPVYSEHLQIGIPLNRPPQREGIRALAVIPIIHKDHVIGGMNISSHTRAEVPLSARNALETIVSQIGYSVLILRTKEALSKSEARYKELWDHAPVAYHMLDTDGIIAKVNHTEASMLGYEVHEMVGKPIFDFVLPDQKEEARKRFRRKIRGLSVPKIENRVYLKKDGSHINVVIDDVLERDADGKITGIRSTMADITDRKRIEEELIKSEEKYRSLVETASSGIATTDTEGKFTFVNKKICELCGYSKAEMMGKQFADFLHPDDRKKIMQVFEKAFINPRGNPYAEFRVIHKDGHIVHMCSYPTAFIHEGRLLGFNAIITNITELKRAEEALRESEERFRTLYENSTIGLYRTTPDGRIHLANPALIRMLGYSSFAELSTRNLEKSGFEPSYPRTQFVRIIEKEGEVKGLESAWKRKDGTIIFIRESARAIRDSRAKTLYYDGTVEDITERKRAEEEAVRHTKNIEFLSETAMGFVELPAEKDIYWFIGEKLRQLIDDAIYLLINSFDQNTGEIQVRALLADDRHRQAILKTLGSYPLGISFVVSKEAWNGLISGKLVRVPGGIHGLSFGQIPKAACDALEKLAGIGDIFTMGFTRKGELYGSATIIMREGSRLSNRDVVETLVRQAGVALQRKRAEEALRESRKRFQALTETTSDFVWEMDANGVYTYCSPQINELWGYKPEDMIGKTPFELMIPEDREHAIKMFRTIAESPSSFKGMETSNWDNAGRMVVLETSGVPFFDMDGRLRGYRGISRDITERKRAEDELRKSEAGLKEAQALGRIGSWEFDLDSGAVQWSDQVYRLYERDPAMGPPGVEEEASYYSPEQAGILHEYARIAGEQGQAFEYDLEARLPSGRIAHFGATMRPVRDRTGRIVKLFGTVQDITERKRAEAERERLLAELEAKNRELESFVYTVSHDLKAPLVSLSGFSSVLQKEFDNRLGEEGKHCLERIQANVALMDALIASLLELSRIGKVVGTVKEVNVVALLKEIRGVLAIRLEEAGAKFVVQEPLPTIHADRDRIRQVFINLVDNAVKFRSAERALHIEVGCRPEGDFYRFHVADNGIGLASQYHEQIFSPFRKLHLEIEGMGIGLALVKKIVEHHGGRVWVESPSAEFTPGKTEGPDAGLERAGATFYFTLPKERRDNPSRRSPD